MKDKGFTLVELLAVIVILAVILAIAVPAISGIMNGTTKSAFESDTKMVLKQLEYETIENESFDVASINEETVATLDLSNKNYQDLKVGVIDNDPYIIITGKEKWAGLKACGNIKNIKVVDASDTTNCVKIPVVISSMHPQIVTHTCNPADLISTCMSEISLFSFGIDPVGYLKCDGRALPIASYPTLFALIGTTYGGDGTTTFALPNLTSKIPLAGLSYYMATGGISPNWTNATSLTSVGYNYFSYQSSFQNYLVGEIRLVTSVDDSDNSMLPCDGRTLQVADYMSLYSLIGATYGGDGVTTFNLPNLSSATSPVAGAKYYIVVNGALPVRQ